MIIALVVSMTRDEIWQHNQNVIALVISYIRDWQARRLHYRSYRVRLPWLGHKELVKVLNADNIKTSRGNKLTVRSLYKKVQRQTVRLHDLIGN